MARYFQLFDTDVNAWAGDYPTLDEALTAVREWAEHDGDGISDALALCAWNDAGGFLIAEGPALLAMARQSIAARAT